MVSPLKSKKKSQIKTEQILQQQTGRKAPLTEIPKELKAKAGELFCPYCGIYAIFKRDRKLSMHRCPQCGISTKDFHVKKVNKLEKVERRND